LSRKKSTSLERNAGSDALAKKLDMKTDAVRQAVAQMRRRYRDAVRERIAATLADPTAELISTEMETPHFALA